MIKVTITKNDESVSQDTFDDFRALGKWMEENHGTFIALDAMDTNAIRKEGWR